MGNLETQFNNYNKALKLNPINLIQLNQPNQPILPTFAWIMDDILKTETQTKWLYLFIGIAALINFSGLLVPIMAPDGALYAMITKTMVLHHNYVDLVVGGKDWLDKPHFPFWITALSFNCFGLTTWAYKLPAILFLLMGGAYTYLFGKSLYNKQVALWSVLILLTAQHIVLSNNDVRAEPYLTGLIIAAVYHLYKADKNNSYWQLLAGCVFTACAIMTKGMFAILPIGGAIAGQLIITKQWHRLFNLKWLIAILLTIVFILPELWCLYRQFDVHPEKVIFGRSQVSGIKFFFWDSQFGRFFNTGPIKGHGDPFFFVHTALWAFLPWSLLMFAAIFQNIKKGFKNVQGQEWYCISGALLTFLLFLASKFQLPHYLNIVFPFFAIITAQYLFNLQAVKAKRAVVITQTIVILLMLLLISLLHYYFNPAIYSWFILALPATLYLALRFFKVAEDDAISRIMYQTLVASFLINLYLNLSFYPSLMKYQSANEAAVWINSNNPGNLPVAEVADDFSPAFEFYINAAVTSVKANGQLPPKPFLLYCSVDAMKSLSARGLHITLLNNFRQYRITRLKPSFLNEKTRRKELTTMEVVVVN
jgi:4-amino-4-deoxy-L-arabinose transferase-like glycosyltransferase